MTGAASAFPGAHTEHSGTEDRDPLSPQGSLEVGGHMIYHLNWDQMEGALCI